MKKIKYFIACSILIFFSGLYGMNRSTSSMAPTSSSSGNPSSVQVYFVPEDNITSPLFQFLGEAQNELLIAMYWITDDFIVNKLIELRRRGVNIGIIVDESSPNLMPFMSKLLNNNILPIIFPSNTQGIGIMHNKFIVADGTKVFTGSANFTQRAFNPTSQLFNYENVLTVYSRNIAERYRSVFFDIEEAAFNVYAGNIAENDIRSIPAWMKQLLPILYSQDNRFQRVVRSVLPNSNSIEQSRLRSFFRLQTNLPRQRAARPTPKQEHFLKRSGAWSEGISKKEASKLIGRIIEQKKRQRHFY